MLPSHTLSLSGSYPEVWGGTENPRGDEGGPARPLGGKARSEGNAWRVLSDPRGTGSHRSRWAGLVPARNSFSGPLNADSKPGRPTARDCGGRYGTSFSVPKAVAALPSSSVSYL